MSERGLVVSNSNPLIWLAKIGRLGLLKSLFGTVIIPRRVFVETIVQRQFADSILIGKAVEEGWVEVREADPDAGLLSNVAGMHPGEAEAILLSQRLGSELIVDEREASATAQMFGVRPIGTIAVLLLALAECQITLVEIKESLDNLVASGFWLSVDVYGRVLDEASTIIKDKD